MAYFRAKRGTYINFISPQKINYEWRQPWPTGVSKWKFMLQNDINSIFREKEKQRKLETGATKAVIAITTFDK